MIFFLQMLFFMYIHIVYENLLGRCINLLHTTPNMQYSLCLHSWSSLRYRLDIIFPYYSPPKGALHKYSEPQASSTLKPPTSDVRNLQPTKEYKLLTLHHKPYLNFTVYIELCAVCARTLYNKWRWQSVSRPQYGFYNTSLGCVICHKNLPNNIIGCDYSKTDAKLEPSMWRIRIPRRRANSKHSTERILYYTLVRLYQVGKYLTRGWTSLGGGET